MRAGGRCELCKSDVDLQIDHCFSRSVKEIFYEPSNLTALCQVCHFQKTYHIRCRDLDVYAHVMNREGKDEYQRLKDLARAMKPFPDFNRRWWLELKMEESDGSERD